MKTTSVIEREIVYHGNEYSDAPSKVRLSFTGEDAHRVALCMSLIKENKEKVGINSIRIESPDYELFDSDDELEEDWRDEGGQLIVFENTIYFYSQSKWDSSDQIESDGIDFNEIMEGFTIINAESC